ncbi:MAG: NTP transferase domain-containing protein [Planctomycetota bacterium]
MLPVYVMIGGSSRRFGREKAIEPVDGQPWAMHVGTRLASEGSPIVLVGGRKRTVEAARWVSDEPSLEGPLGGLRAALNDRMRQYGPGLLVFASCDLVRPRAEWLTPLVEAHRDTQHPVSVAAYRTAGRWQPFPSVLHTRLAALLKARDAAFCSLQEVFDGADNIEHTWPTESGPPQANTQDELRRLLART